MALAFAWHVDHERREDRPETAAEQKTANRTSGRMCYSGVAAQYHDRHGRLQLMETSLMIEKPAYNIQEVLTFHPAGRTKLYEDIKEGRLKARKIGDRTVILHKDYMAYLDALPALEPSSAGESA